MFPVISFNSLSDIVDRALFISVRRVLAPLFGEGTICCEERSGLGLGITGYV